MAQTKTSGPQLIKKEDIPKLTFSDTDILSTPQERFQVKIDMQRASALGAQSKSNVKIYFVDAAKRRFKVEATVWAATEKNVTLKGEVLIPVQAIYKIGFF